MENFNAFPSNTNKPCHDVENTSRFLQDQMQDGEIYYPNTQHASPLQQPQQISEMNFQSNVSQYTIPSVTFSSVPIGVSSYSEELLQAQESENRRSQARIARTHRKIALQMSNLKNTYPSFTPDRTSKKLRKKLSSERNKSSDEEHNTIYTLDNVKLRVVLQKILTCSDVGDQGRILLPKKEVEENLPGLATREGVLIAMKEVYSYTEWRMKYRFWANHKGNIYLFDQCDEFVQKNLLEAGDQLNLYQDEQKNLEYFTIKKKEKHTPGPCNSYISMTSKTTEEEDSSLRILMEELEHKEVEEPNTLNSLYNTSGFFP
ncbi:B3 domain-containing transcription factor LEC2-like [Lactuca sativa]|uniref:B3 domain-containing transcription factor LEC2-like n=1 Tax=Lactuca sativa TaxID=4236 RepID=UPI0022B01015|nr:B3 domain-containing transcription factor LEC2-like [Lactuca sativa]